MQLPCRICRRLPSPYGSRHVMTLDACQFRWSNTRIVWVVDILSPNRSLQTISRCWCSEQTSKPTVEDDSVDNHIFSKMIRGTVNANHEIPGVWALSRAALGAPRQWTPYRWVIHDSHVMFVIGRVGRSGRHEERQDPGTLEWGPVELPFESSMITASIRFDKRHKSFQVLPLRSRNWGDGLTR